MGMSSPTGAAMSALYPKINGCESVAALRLRRKQHHRQSKLNQKSIIPSFWKLPYKDRIKLHPGYYNVDLDSFYELTEINDINFHDDVIDNDIPLEFIDIEDDYFPRRDVTDWLVSLENSKQNKRCYLRPIYHPKSMVININSSKIPKEWNEDWYMTWEAQMKNPNNLMKAAHKKSSRRNKTKKQRRQKQRLSHWKKNKDSNVIAEIGTISTVRVMQENLSRVHYEYTSSLISSRWRRKYVKNDMF